MNNKYSSIIGLNPSKGARSPKLWNKAYIKNKSELRMNCIDIDNEMLLQSKLKELDEDQNFLGGCIAYPYKESVAKYLGPQRIDSETRPIKSVNCLYRSDQGYLVGTNTDGFASLDSFSSLINSYQLNSILIAGLGGAGKAVTSFVSKYYLKYNVKVNAISRENNKDFCTSINVNWYSWERMESLIDKCDAFINCTSLGSDKAPEESPLSNIQVRDSSIKFIYDIIYNPSPTKLLSYAIDSNIKCKDGLEMNLLQAAKAFKFVNKVESDIHTIL